jgi:ABC-type transport system involved in multi-copper enzyme maturation permease subunit
MTAFATIFSLELQALARRRLTLVGLVAAAAVAAIGAGLALLPEAQSEFQSFNGWRCLAWGLGPGVVVASLISLLLGSQSLAAAAQEGSLRATLCRPVSRRALLLAKAGAIALVALGLTLVVVLIGLLVGLAPGFGRVMLVLGDRLYPQHAAGVMAGHALTVCLLAPLLAMAAGLIGLAVSALSDHGGAAASAAMLCALPFAVGGAVPSSSATWVFPKPGVDTWRTFQQMAGGAAIGWSEVSVGHAFWVPTLTAAVALAFALVAFTRRDVLS